MRKKKLLSAVMTAAMATTLFAGMSVMSFAASTSYTGQTAQGTYTISTASQLNTLATKVNGGENYSGSTFTLTGNIALSGSWTQIGNSEANAFQGTFNGNKKTISGLTISSGSNIGLFGYLGHGATVENLTLTNGTVSGSRSVGTIAGKNWGKILNCHNNGVTVTGSQAKGVGGIVGANWVYTASGVTYDAPVVDNCTNSAAVTSTYSRGSAGGIAGENEGEVRNCANTGKVTSPYNAGGLVGSNKNNFNQKTQTGGDVYGGVANSYNTGNVNGAYAGGIIAYQIGSCVNCYNLGTITGSTDGGQLIGTLNSSSSYTNDNLHYISGTTPYGNTTSVTGATSFTNDSTGSTSLLADLNDWVRNSSVYYTWTVDTSTNNGFPIFS